MKRRLSHNSLRKNGIRKLPPRSKNDLNDAGHLRFVIRASDLLPQTFVRRIGLTDCETPIRILCHRAPTHPGIVARIHAHHPQIDADRLLSAIVGATSDTPAETCPPHAHRP